MMTTHELKKQARNALKGNWWIAILCGLLCMTLVGSTYGFFSINFNVNIQLPMNDVRSEFVQNSNIGIIGGADGPTAMFVAPRLVIHPDYVRVFLSVFTIIVAIVLVVALFSSFIFSPVAVGHRKFNMNLLHGVNKKPVQTMFEYYKSFWNVASSMFMRALYTFLWTLLFIIPGIVKTYSYAMVPYILAEEPAIGYRAAITKSRTMMRGHKFELFWLQLTFLGWSFLNALTFGIGTYWLFPYASLTEAAFYEQLKNQSTIPAYFSETTPENPDTTSTNI